eukprot:CAMPEP_0206507384 /NCGR_PEP_ID=MMETSP0324_2-20121206/57476_1 /ASSEMBLY_ACC=CAM_ASM_000836 /TAXON_ID=2866 /ORGANISM="Crypthecodinium cohnii, Strain Seligo" /LENGTH=38 /DNA_ID= /DNA_START= /DNA_END= /DNA_ORIENTATION=
MTPGAHGTKSFRMTGLDWNFRPWRGVGSAHRALLAVAM